jgi:hypothetical protein
VVNKRQLIGEIFYFFLSDGELHEGNVEDLFGHTGKRLIHGSEQNWE